MEKVDYKKMYKDLAKKDKSVTDKSNYKYKMMIRQPEFLTDALYKRFLSELKIKSLINI